ncbi:hypothetical protein FA95DRAFT_160829 [Auriscalpium vulgare]|uniref:Uncharacterized protein n=1 Tax=Auriscalpium vulgare TaxID=40419 RepID=A0ACB8RLZ6_9AGAM|nr:hypothetical protein FA95DRAFT_160829 [Auriscalpium vulgare]
MAVSTILHVLPHTLDILIPLLLHSYKPLSNPKISNGHDWLEEDPPASSKDGQPACVPPSALPYDDLYFALDIVLIPLASLLLLPCIRAFSALTTMHLRYVLDGSCDAHASQPLTAALPASPGSYSTLLARLISSTLQVLTSLCDRSRSPASNHDPALVSRVQALHDRLALACFHELLQVLLSCPPRSSTQNPKESTRTRFTRLAQKDSMHVLCMTLRICLTTPSSVCKTGTPLREALGRALADIVSIATKGALDEIEEAMLLSVVERAWEAGITMGGEGWWEDGQP